MGDFENKPFHCLSLERLKTRMPGCASVNMASKEQSAKAKEFQLPPEGQTGAYLYRNSVLGKALSKDLRIDGNCVSVSAPDVFSTRRSTAARRAPWRPNEFSPNKLELF